MTITIHCDASVADLSSVGSYAYWIDGPAGDIREAGVFDSACRNSTEAEVKAIVNALHVVLVSGWTGIERIIVNSDSEPAMHLVQKGGKNKSPGAHYGALYCNYLLHGLRIKYDLFGPNRGISFRHVKAHSGRGDPRSRRNDWCDIEAKKELKKALSLLRA